MNVKCFIVLLMTAFAGLSLVDAQTVTGTVYDSDGFPLTNTEVSVKGSGESTYTDEEGNFSLQVPEGKGDIEVFTLSGTESFGYNVSQGDTQELGDLNIAPTLNEVVVVGRGVIDVEEDRKTPVAVNTVFKDEIQEKAQGNVEFPEVLKNTPSVYVANQAGGFGDSQMFTRGFNQSNTAFLLNGQPINGMEDGNMYWSNWSGMTDIANAVQIQRGLGSSKLAISSVGGTINIITKAAEKRKGGFVQGIVGNDSYFKFGGGYNTGLSEKGWAFSFALSYWQAHRKYARGTAGQGQNYFFSVGKKINDRHNLNFLITGAPQWHDQNFSKEFDYGNSLGYDYINRKWNANYGFLNGDAFTWRKNYYHKPILNLNWDFDINDRMALSTVAYGSFGRGGGTGPRGNTYRFEAYNDNPNFDPASYYQNNGDFRFDRIYQENMQVTDGAGSYNNGNLLRSSVNNHNWFGLVSNFNMEVNENFNFNVGFDGRLYKGDHFRQVADYIGLNSWGGDRPDGQIVTEAYDPNPWASLFNYADEDQRIAYDNSEWINYFGGFGQAEYATEKFSVFFQGSVSSQSYQREDRFNRNDANEKETIKSGKSSKMGYNVKGGGAYNVNANHSLFVNAGLYSRQPFLDNIYDYRTNHITEFIKPDVENEEITGFEGGYVYNTSGVRLNINGYYTTWANRTLVSRDSGYEAPDGNTYAEVVVQDTGVKQEHRGFEIDFNAKASSALNLRGYFSYGVWKIVDGYTTKVYNDEDNTLVDQYDVDGDVEEYVTQAPQFSTGFGIRYKFTRALSVDSDFNYYARNYNRFENDGSTLDPYALVDLGVTYVFKFGSQNLKFRGNVNNLFNSTFLNQADRYGYFYGNGRTWNLGVTANF